MGKRIVKRTGLIFFVLVFLEGSLFSPLAVYAQDSQTQEILDTIEVLASKVGGYHADLTMVYMRKGEREELFGKTKRLGQSRSWEKTRRGKDKRSIACRFNNGVVKWNYNPELRFAIKETSGGHEWLARETVHYLRTEYLTGEKVYVFECKGNSEIPIESPDKFDRCEFFFRTEDGLFRKLITYDAQGRVLATLNHFNIRPDSSITEKDFEFDPPPGTQVLDFDKGRMK